MPGFKLLLKEKWPLTVGAQLSTPIVLLSMLVTLLLLSLAGHYCSAHTYFKNFVRFNRAATMETLFPTTFAQVLNTVTEKGKGRKLVIIGGDSVFWGHGQKDDQVWSEELARLLAPEFAVINLSERGGCPFELGYWVYEHLRRQGKEAILVTNCASVYPGAPTGNSIYNYFFSEARERDWLETYKERDLWIKQFQNPYTSQYLERTIWQKLDKYLYFRDLWTTVTYDLGSTTLVFSASGKQNYFLPRKYLPEEYDAVEMVLIDEQEARRWSGVQKARNDAAITVNEGGQFKVNPWGYDHLVSNLEPTVVPHLRANIITVTIKPNPFVLSLMDEKDREASKLSDALVLRTYRQLGFNAVYLDSLERPDYIDLEHISPAGGRKLARFIAEKVKQHEKLPTAGKSPD